MVEGTPHDSLERTCCQELQPPNQVAHPDFQRVSDDLQRIERHALAPILQPVEVHAIQTGKLRELVLSDSLFSAYCSDSLANESIDILQCSRVLARSLQKHPA